MATLTKPLATNIKFPIVESLKDPHKKMLALEWHGNKDVRVIQRPRPLITEPTDVVVRVTSTTICGSDLHLYHNEMSGMQKGDIMGHEGMGIIDAVGDQVKNLKVGDRVVVSAVIACGQCYYCKNQMFSCCDNTNPSMEMESLYGHRTSGLFGYSHLTGGYEGCQAEYVRVPLGDMNCLKVPSHLKDEQVIFLSDIACTGWHATELGNVQEGQTVAIWGCGPVGLMAVMWSKFKKAGRVIAIDAEPYRLDMAKKLGAETVNFGEKEVTTAIREMCPGGPDVCIECVGFRFPKSISHKIQRALRMETDTPDVLSECIMCCRKGGQISIVGDYYAFANRFPIGAFMEKSLHAAGGQVFVQKYWKQLLGYIESGEIDLTWAISHKWPLDQASEAYRLFDSHEDNVLKIILQTGATSSV